MQIVDGRMTFFLLFFWFAGVEWEQVDDNGFVYKRRKREVPPEKSHSAAANPLHHDPEVNHKAVPNPALERRKRKQVLLAAKAM